MNTEQPIMCWGSTGLSIEDRVLRGVESIRRGEGIEIDPDTFPVDDDPATPEREEPE